MPLGLDWVSGTPMFCLHYGRPPCCALWHFVNADMPSYCWSHIEIVFCSVMARNHDVRHHFFLTLLGLVINLFHIMANS